MNERVKGVMDFWDRMAGEAEDEFAAVDRTEERLKSELAYLQRTLTLTSNSMVLDLCCGNGLIALPIAERVQRVVGIDHSQYLLDMGKKVLKKGNGENVDLIRGEAVLLPFRDDAFDVVLCYGAFHYFPDYNYAELVMKEVLRVVKSGGTVVLTMIPSKDTVGYHIWNLIRSREKEPAGIVLPARRGRRGFQERLALLFRRITGRRVESDDWLWYKKSFFNAFVGGKFKKVKIFPSQHGKALNYRFDVLISNK